MERTIEQNIDEKSNIISVADSIDGVASALTTYEYDKIDRLVSITQSGNGVTDKQVDFDYSRSRSGRLLPDRQELSVSRKTCIH